MGTNMITFGILGLLALGLIVYSLLPRKSENRDAVKRRLWGRRGADDEAEIRLRAKESAAGELVRKAAPVLSKLTMPSSDQAQSYVRLKLAGAGYRRPQAATLFLASKSRT